MVWLLRAAGVAAAAGAIAVGLLASGMEPRDPDLGAIGRSWLLANLPMLAVWIAAAALALVAAYCFRAAGRFRRLVVGIAAEDAKLRTDPRFVEAWVQHIKTQAPAGTPPSPPGPGPSATDAAVDPADPVRRP